MTYCTMTFLIDLYGKLYIVTHHKLYSDSIIFIMTSYTVGVL